MLKIDKIDFNQMRMESNCLEKKVVVSNTKGTRILQFLVENPYKQVANRLLRYEIFLTIATYELPELRAVDLIRLEEKLLQSDKEIDSLEEYLHCLQLYMWNSFFLKSRRGCLSENEGKNASLISLKNQKIHLLKNVFKNKQLLKIFSEPSENCRVNVRKALDALIKKVEKKSKGMGSLIKKRLVIDKETTSWVP